VVRPISTPRKQRKQAQSSRKKIMTENEIANKVIDIAMEAHKEL